MTTWRHFSPKGIRAWNVEALAQGTPDGVSEAGGKAPSPELILGPLPARWHDREKCPPDSLKVGDFAMLDGRAHQITAIERGWRSRRPKFELQDVACPDMPRHRVAWSEIERVARLTHDPAAQPRAIVAPPE